jgi:hypothetical protein
MKARQTARKRAITQTREPGMTGFGAILDQEIAHAVQAGLPLTVIRRELAARLAAIDAALRMEAGRG